MSSTDSNEEALRLKHQEITALRAALNQKQALKRRQEIHAARVQKRSPYGNQQKPYSQPKKFGNLKLVMNNVSQLEVSRSESSSDGYVSVKSSGGNTLYNVNVYQEEAEKLKQKIELKKQQVKEQKRLNKLKTKITHQRTKYMGCDRIKINGDKYSVTKGGHRLVPSTMFQATNPDNCVWNGIEYKRVKTTGVFKPIKNLVTNKYVSLANNRKVMKKF